MAGFIPEKNATSIGERVAPPDEASPTPKTSDVVVEIKPGIRIRVTSNADDADDNGPPKDPHFDDNLAETLDDGVLNQIALDLIEGIDNDIRSREGFVSNYTKGLDLLGLKLDTNTAARGKRSTSKVWHPLLLWAIIEFQSGACAELYPASGPCKVSVDSDSDADTDNRARHLEQDINHYLTVSAPEYYPDSAQGLFYLGYGGNAYKKVYRCPIRQRPVSEGVYLPDLIVSADATDILNAQRVTHRMEKLSREVRQLQKLKLYRDVELVSPVPDEDPIKKKERDIHGRRPTQDRPKDQPHTIYECYTFLDLTEHKSGEKGQISGIPIPYRVTLDRDSRQVLEIRRNWKHDDELFRRRRMFVKYGLVPGMGFLDYGLLHLLGNSTRALTALWRISIDQGMFSNFPGGIRLRGARSDTNEINPAPGEFVPVDVGGDDLKKAIMPMPYKDVSPALISLMEYIEKDATQVWGSLKFPVGEGKTNIPVGSILSMVEQQTTNMAAVHKRLHKSLAEELQLLKELFEEKPEDLWKFSADPARKWSDPNELKDLKLIPASDPNVPSQTHRIMQATALAQLMQMSGPLMNPIPVLQRILASIGISDTQSLINTNPQSPQADPKAAAAMAKVQVQQQQAQLQLQKTDLDHQGRMQEIAAENQNRQADRDSRERIATMKAATAHQESQWDMALKAHELNTSNQLDAHKAGLQHAQAQMMNQTQLHTAHLSHQVQKEKNQNDLQLGLIPKATDGEDNGS